MNISRAKGATRAMPNQTHILALFADFFVDGDYLDDLETLREDVDIQKPSGCKEDSQSHDGGIFLKSEEKMKLLEPIKIGTLEVKNRIVMPPMHTGFGTEEGEVTERMIHYYEERAKGGAGLIIVEFTAIEPGGRITALELMISDDRFIPGLKKLAAAIKKHGAKVAIQLHHGGIKASAKITQIQPVGPSLFPAFPIGMGPSPRSLIEERNS